MIHAQLVSPPLPSGQSWLVNALLELDICATCHGSWWRETEQGSVLEPDEFREMLKWFLPALHQREDFDFQDELEVFWDHQLAYAQYPQRKTILMVRDPRDAYYSHFRREVHQHGYPNTPERLLESLCAPNLWVSPVTLPMMLPAADIYAYFCLTWIQQLPPEQLLLVRFEDTRSDPAGQLQRVLDFLGLQRTSAQIAAAVAASDVSKAQALNQHMENASGQQRLLSRAGKTGEAKAALSPEALQQFAGPAQKLIRILGYEPLEQPSCQPDSELLERAKPQLQAYTQLIQNGQIDEAQNFIQQQIQQSAQDQELELLLAGQLLALLWTRVILRQGLMQLPLARRMIQSLARLNAEFSAWPPIQRTALEILDPLHPLHHIGPSANVFATAEPDFDLAATAALASGQPLFFWNPGNVQLTQAGFLQLRELVDGRNPEMQMVCPVITTESQDFLQQAFERHAAIGAEFRRLPANQVQPPCMMMLSRILPSLQAGESWSLFEARGVLALNSLCWIV